MSKNKYNFAYELLSSSRVTPEQKKRILALIAQERNEDIVLLENRIGNLEKKEEAAAVVEEVKVEEKEVEEVKDEGENIEVENKSTEIYYKKIDVLPKFLKSLNTGTFTKYLTHKIDSDDFSILSEELKGEYIYEKHLEKIRENFSILTEKYNIDKQIYTKINTYINGGENGWSEDDIQMNWSHPELLKWVKAHPNTPPASDEDLEKESFTFKSRDEIISFSDLIIRFKNQIHIRRENPLKNIVRKANRNFKLNIEFDKIDDKINFYTDVEKLIQMFKICFSWIKESEEPEKNVIINLKLDDNYIYIYVHHLSSIFGQNKNTLRFGKSSINLMQKANGVCNISIITNFSENEYEELPIWQYGRKIEKNNNYDKVIDTNTNKEIIPANTLKNTGLLIKGQQVIYKFTISRGL